MSESAEPVGRPMRYPYTITAKVAQFPFKFHFQNAWLFRYFIYGSIVAFPVFYKIHRLANSPGNVQAFHEKKRKEAEEHHH